MESVTSPISLIRNTRNLTLNFYNSVAAPKSYNTSIIDMRSSLEPNNISHLMTDIIPLCLHIKSLTTSDTRFIFTKIRKPFIDLLSVFGISPIISNRKLKGSIVKLLATRSFAMHSIYQMPDYSASYFLPDIYSSFNFKSNLVNSSKIFIARKGARRLSNQDEIEQFLMKNGYNTIYMEDYSFEDQLGIASGAKDIVAIHGAAIGLLRVSRYINSLVEIFPPNVYHDYFPLVLGNKVKSYVQIIPSFDFRTPYNGWDAILEFKNNSFSLELSKLEQALQTVKDC